MGNLSKTVLNVNEKFEEASEEADCTCGVSLPFQKRNTTATLLILTMLSGTLCHVGSPGTLLSLFEKELAAPVFLFAFSPPLSSVF